MDIASCRHQPRLTIRSTQLSLQPELAHELWSIGMDLSTFVSSKALNVIATTKSVVVAITTTMFKSC